MAEEKEYYILSLKWSKGNHYVWWGPDNSGYTTDIEKAGKYKESLVKAKRGYYSSASTMPVLCDLVNQGQKQVVSVADTHNYKLFGIGEHLKTAKEY